MKWAAGSMASLVMLVVLVIAPMMEQPEAPAGLNADALPAAAIELLPLIAGAAEPCPDLPLSWLVAQIEVESSYDPAAVSPVGAAGLLQMMPTTWVDVDGTGGTWPTSGPPPGHPVLEPASHLPVAVRLMCANLRDMAVHLAATGKPVTPLQAMAVCHVAGCSRVRESAGGIPTAGEAGCGAACVAEITAYIGRIEQLHARYRAVGPPVVLSGQLPPPPAPWTGGSTTCGHPDPTGGGCVTGATLHGHTQIVTAAGGRWPWGASCWDPHEWNPSSDHPKGRACDYTIGDIGTLPDTQLVEHGWTWAEWLRTHAGVLDIRYVIWQGRIWQAHQAAEGWQPYTGGGVYDPNSPTGGHYDHLHISWN